jgi:ketosteroid isomerase-like protein
MTASRRSVLAAAGASFVPVGLTEAAGLENGELAMLVQKSFESNAALMRGDIARYRELVTLTDDFTLMSPFGGTPTHGSAMTSDRWEAMGRFFKRGTLDQKVIASYGTGDMVVLVTIEHAHVEVGDLPRQDWRLRVTLVYRRHGSEWRLAHRHADPLVTGITLSQAALLARGEA